MKCRIYFFDMKSEPLSPKIITELRAIRSCDCLIAHRKHLTTYFDFILPNLVSSQPLASGACLYTIIPPTHPPTHHAPPNTHHPPPPLFYL